MDEIHEASQDENGSSLNSLYNPQIQLKSYSSEVG